MFEEIIQYINNINHRMRTVIYNRIQFGLFLWIAIGPFILIAILMILGIYPIHPIMEIQKAEQLLRGVHLLYLFAPAILFPFILNRIRKYFTSINLLLKKVLIEFENERDMIDTPERVLEKIDMIYDLVNSLIRKKYYIWIFLGGKVYTLYISLLNKVFLYLKNIMDDLHSDLQIQLIEERKILKKAKSEVSTHIQGTDVLNQVSELQRARLDRQIEQFEELQRVMVKV